MSKEETKVVGRGAHHFLFGTFLSRLSGFSRDLATAFCLGTHPALASFMVAFRFAHLLRRLIGEARLGNAFIPHFETLRAEAPREAGLFVRDLFFSAGAAVLVIVVLLEGGLMLFASGSEIVQLTMLMLPGLFFIALFALGSGILQCEGKFMLSGAAPMAFNCVWIALVVLLQGEPSRVVMWLALGVTLALGLQWLITLPKTLSVLRGTLQPADLVRPRLFPKEVRALIPPLLLASIGLGAEQLGSVMDALFARAASLEGPAYLWYAIRIEQLPLALFAIAYATSLLPSLSRFFHAGDEKGALALVHFALRRSFTYVLPAALALCVCGFALINLLYGRGSFSQEAVGETTRCLWGYALGLVPAAWVILLATPFFAVKDFWTPAKLSLVTIGVNGALNALFIFGLGLGAASVALSTGFSSLVNALLLFRQVKKRFGPLGTLGEWSSPLRLTAASLLAAFLTLVLGAVLVGDPTLALVRGESVAYSTVFTEQLLHCTALGGLFLVQLFAYSWWFKAMDLFEVLGLGFNR